MTATVIAAIITGISAIIGAFVGQTMAGQRQTTQILQEISAHSELGDESLKSDIRLIKNEIENLRKQVEKHNGVIERTFKLERRMDVAEERIQVANHRIKDLEQSE